MCRGSCRIFYSEVLFKPSAQSVSPLSSFPLFFVFLLPFLLPSECRNKWDDGLVSEWRDNVQSGFGVLGKIRKREGI